MDDPVRMAVVGVGYFGSRHAEKIARLPGAELVAVADIDRGRAEAAGRAHRVPGLADPKALLGRVDAVSVAVPTVAHFEVASRFLDAGVHVLLEKPIAETPEAARRLIDLAARRGAVLQIGHLERFSAPVLAIRDRISRPLYIESNRISAFQARGTDVNVILEMMIHDIDLILTLAGASIESVDAVGAPVLSDVEDIANARVRFANGAVATITASRVSTKAERKLRVFQPDCYISIDFLDRTVRVVEKGKAKAGSDYPELSIETRSYQEVDALAAEIAAFVSAVANGTPPLVGGEDGLKALEAALMITRSLRAHWDRIGHGVPAGAAGTGPSPSARTAMG
ncbi:MAG: Gfo/Idh/MocA family protein [Kiloniellaceae bacterium]